MVRLSPYEGESALRCLEKVAAALASLILFVGNKDTMTGEMIEGLDRTAGCLLMRVHFHGRFRGDIRCLILLRRIALLRAFLHRVSSLSFAEIGGLQEAVRVCKRHAHPRVLASVCTIIAAMTPKPQDLLVSSGPLQFISTACSYVGTLRTLNLILPASPAVSRGFSASTKTTPWHR